MHGMKLERLSPEEKQNFYALGKSQIDYILGDSGRSFVVGFGENPPKNPHHRQGIYRWFGKHWTAIKVTIGSFLENERTFKLVFMGLPNIVPLNRPLLTMLKIVYRVAPKKIIIMPKCQ